MAQAALALREAAGGDVALTIDSALQAEAEEALQELIAQGIHDVSRAVRQ